MKKQAVVLAVMAVMGSEAQAREGLTVYTYDSFVAEWGAGPKLEAAFEAHCECDLKFVAAADGAGIVNRLRIEGMNTKADVVLGMDDALMATALAENLVQPHGLKHIEYAPALQWQHESFIPFDYGYFAFIYDTERTPRPVGSLKALVDSGAPVLYQDPRTSTPGQGMLVWMNEVYGAGAPEAWTKLASHTVTVTKGWWEAYSLFLKGDAEYVLSYTTSPAYHQVVENSTRYKAAQFQEGHIMQVEVAGISSHTRKKALAQQFLTFLTSKEAQEIIPVTNWMLPVRTDVSLPKAFSSLIPAQKLPYDQARYSEQREQWLKQWRFAASQ